MNKEHKRAGIGFLILISLGLIPLGAVSWYYYDEPISINAAHTVMAKTTNVNPELVTEITQPKIEPELEQIFVDEIVIVEKRIVKKNPAPTQKNWVCEAPRPLEQGSGWVQECDWK